MSDPRDDRIPPRWIEWLDQQVDKLAADYVDDPDALDSAYDDLTSYVTEHWFAHLDTVIPALIDRQWRYANGFERRLENRWRKGLQCYEAVLTIARIAGERFYTENVADAAARDDAVFYSLSRLHSRACLTGSEILALLRTGHASGAHARWRTLHELAVIAFFISQHGDEIARRYIRHQHIDVYQAARQYQLHYQRLGHAKPLTEAEIQELKEQRDLLITEYGREFKKPYGWAAPIFGRAPTFDKVEESVGLDHVRPYYKMASYSVHAASRSLHWGLGADAIEVMLAGPSNAGLADPGHGAAISLMHVTTAFVNLQPAPQWLVVTKTLMRLVERAGEELLATHQQLEAEETAKYIRLRSGE